MTILGDAIVLGLMAIGILLLLFETIAPGSYLAVVGVGLIVTGGVGLLLNVTNPILLSVILVASSGVVFAFYNRLLDSIDDEVEETGQERLVGMRGETIEPVGPDGGRVKLHGSTGSMSNTFSARSEHGTIPEDTDIIVTEAGVQLRVIPEHEVDVLFEEDTELETN